MPGFIQRTKAKIAAADLPYGPSRMLWIFLLWATSLAGGTSCVGIFIGTGMMLDTVEKKLPPGLKLQYIWEDLRITNIFLFIGVHLFTFATAKIIICFFQDVYNFLPLRFQRWAGIEGKKTSTTTLGWQIGAIIVALIMTLASEGVLIWLALARGPELHLTGPNGQNMDQMLPKVPLPRQYFGYKFVVKALALPWMPVVVAIPALIVSIMGQRQAKQRAAAAASAPRTMGVMQYNGQYGTGLSSQSVNSYENSKEKDMSTHVEIVRVV